MPLTLEGPTRTMRCSGTVGWVTRTDRASAVPKTRVTAGNHRPAGFGASRPASAAVPVSAPAREGAAQPTPQARTVRAHSPLRPWSWRSCPYQFRRSFFGTWRLLLPVPAWAEAPASVRRRRALETRRGDCHNFSGTSCPVASPPTGDGSTDRSLSSQGVPNRVICTAECR